MRGNKVELLVIGAGPAGLGASIEAAKRGVDVLLVDENDRPGGQLFKQIHKFFGSKEHMAGTRGIIIGEKLLAEAKKYGVKISLNSTVLGIMENGKVSFLKNGRVEFIDAKKIVLATGASEKAISFPGWTLPGVITAGAAQTMANIHRVLPGEKILMVGSGNVGLIVSYQLLQAGAEVVGIVEAKSNITGYAVHAGKVRRAGVPVYSNHTIKEVRGQNFVEEAVIIALDDNGNYISGTEKVFSVDTVCIAVGLEPRTQLAELLGCKLIYSGKMGGFLTAHDLNMQSSREGVFVAGDLTGIEEANTALDEGRLAGIAAAQSLGYITPDEGKKLKKQIWARLKNLRMGPFGIDRARSKGRIIEEAQDYEEAFQL